MQAILQISIKIPCLNLNSKSHQKRNDSTLKRSCFHFKILRPISNYTGSRIKIESCRNYRVKMGVFQKKLPFSLFSRENDVFVPRRGKRVVLVKFKNGLNGGDGGGGGRISSETARVLGNLAVAILLAYLSMTGQLGWLLDTIVSLWLIAVLVPIVGVGAFLWWAGRDILQGSCPNCGNEFQVFKSSLNDDVQLCPFCTQPFSVEGDKFVRDPVGFSNQTIFDQASTNFSTRKDKGKKSSVSVVDVEAEVRDVD